MCVAMETQKHMSVAMEAKNSTCVAMETTKKHEYVAMEINTSCCVINFFIQGVNEPYNQINCCKTIFSI